MRYELHLGDNREVLRSMPSDSVDSIVSDPPYELGFMGKRWDSTGIAYDVTLWAECMRVLKPGGHLLAFGGSRTYHRLAVAIEDAGFEIRDCIMWLYGSGFPKSHDVSKALDKQAGAEREVVKVVRKTHMSTASTNDGWARPSHYDDEGNAKTTMQITAPATPLAQQWQGWGTALKPAHEPIVVARKPLHGTVADNVQAWGVGALNIDGCRVGLSDGESAPSGSGNGSKNSLYSQVQNSHGNDGNTTPASGRWPANIILDEEAAQMLDEQSGVSKSSVRPPLADRENDERGTWQMRPRKTAQVRGYSDSDGASRFFYVAKASKAERKAGLDAPDGERANRHPTIKPITLMRYLVRMVTPCGGVVLDPFMGSGTTGCAAMLEAMRFIGIDITPEYVDIADRRIQHWASQNPMEL